MSLRERANFSSLYDAPDAGVADVGILKLAGRPDGVGNDLFQPGFRQVGAARIADIGSGATIDQGMNLDFYPFGQRALITEVADQNDIPARIGAADEIIIRHKK